MANEEELKFAGEFPAATHEQWLRLVDGVLKGAPFDKKLVSQTYDGLKIQPLYPRASAAHTIPARLPGAPWLVHQRVDHPDAAAAHAEALHDLENGATGLTLVFAGSEGAYGYGLDSSLPTLERALDGVYIEGISLDLDLSWNASDAPAHIAAIAKHRKLDPAALDFRMNFDPLGSMALTGASLVDWKTMAPRFAGMIAEFASQGFRGPFALADGRVIHAAGGSEAQELAWVLASAVAYLRAFEGGRIALDAARKMISFKLAADADQFLTIAKFRALRKLWARVEEACGVTPEPAFIAAETAWRMMAKRDPWVNLLRTTIATFAAGLGGANAISVLPFTSALGLPDRFARRLARNTQLILLEESNLDKVGDPSAGSGGIEDLTQQLCGAAWKLFQEIEAAGGASAALESGLLQGKVAATRAEREKAIARGREALTGTSAFPDIHEKEVAVFDTPRVPPAAPTHAEVTVTPLAEMRLAEPFEALRDASDRMLAKTGTRPKVFFANLGTAADFTTRATFARNFFEAGGIEAVTNEGFLASPLPMGEVKTGIAALIAAYKESGAPLACICSTDSIYATGAAITAQALKQAGAKHIYLAGRPGELETALETAGVADYIYMGCDMLTTLKAAHGILGSNTTGKP